MEEVLDELERIAPVTAVRGNADKDWAVYLPEKALLEFEGNIVISVRKIERHKIMHIIKLVLLFLHSQYSFRKFLKR